MTETGGGPLGMGAEHVLAPLVGLPMWGAARERDETIVRLGGRKTIDTREVGEYELRILCAWRLSDSTGIVAGSGDLFTPADPDAEFESFDWEPPGSTWLDVRLERFAEAHASAAPVVTTFVADPVGGFRLVLTDGVELDVFPNSSPAEHVETEFWRLTRPGEGDVEIVAGTFGIVLQSAG